MCHMRAHGAPLTAPLAQVYSSTGGRPTGVTPALITKTPQDTVRALGHGLGFLPIEVSARLLRAAGAMALLVAKVDQDIIQILGHWRSDKMFCYLHLTAEPIMRHFTAEIVNADFMLAPSQLVPYH